MKNLREFRNALGLPASQNAPRSAVPQKQTEPHAISPTTGGSVAVYQKCAQYSLVSMKISKNGPKRWCPMLGHLEPFWATQWVKPGHPPKYGLFHCTTYLGGVDSRSSKVVFWLLEVV